MLWAELSHQPVAADASVPAQWLAQWQDHSGNPLPAQFIDRAENFPSVSPALAIAQQNFQTVERLKNSIPWL
jgi:hypothetical protein